MKNVLLIDATQSEDTRVVVLEEGKVSEYDIESEKRNSVKGNIYLATVVRVEPSLQAAFVDFGGGKHGFLPFSEIHPDYYDIPAADREILMSDQEYDLSSNEVDGADVVINDSSASNSHEPAIEVSPIDFLDLDEKPVPRRKRRSQYWHRKEDKAESDSENSAEISASATDAKPDELKQNLDSEKVANTDNASSKVAAEDNTSSSDAINDSHELAQIGHNRPPSDEDNSEQAPEKSLVVTNDSDEENNTSSHSSELASNENTSDEDNNDQDQEIDHADDDDLNDETKINIDSVSSGIDLDFDSETEPEVIRPMRKSRNPYKIQEVIKRNKVLLVQIIKDERGGKGAALSTYLSLAGRYCVLMPQMRRGAGVSKKITDITVRKRLRGFIDSFGIPENVGLIIRTAGAERTKTEIKRDFDNMARMWDGIREATINSKAPSMIHEEGVLIHRSVRDLYSKDVEGIIVAGKSAFQLARKSMKILMPSHVRNIKLWEKNDPLLATYGVEKQLADLMSPIVQLPSGGYIVINQTEALVAIDVNSGSSTKEHNFEATALKTNMEAAHEVGRQLRLRDLGGLTVIDFIDMRARKNNRIVEKCLKEALERDRARVQVGKISNFGLLELSRQRLRSSVAEEVSEVCTHCNGFGRVQTLEYRALSALRQIEVKMVENPGKNLRLFSTPDVSAYLLNAKRSIILKLEQNFSIRIEILTSFDQLAGTFQVQVISDGDTDSIYSIYDPARSLLNDATDANNPNARQNNKSKRSKRKKPKNQRFAKQNLADGAENAENNLNEDKSVNNPGVSADENNNSPQVATEASVEKPPAEVSVSEESATKPTKRTRSRPANRGKSRQKDLNIEANHNSSEGVVSPDVTEKKPSEIVVSENSASVEKVEAVVDGAEIVQVPPKKKPARRRPAKRTKKEVVSDDAVLNSDNAQPNIANTKGVDATQEANSDVQINSESTAASAPVSPPVKRKPRVRKPSAKDTNSANVKVAEVANSVQVATSNNNVSIASSSVSEAANVANTEVSTSAVKPKKRVGWWARALSSKDK